MALAVGILFAACSIRLLLPYSAHAQAARIETYIAEIYTAQSDGDLQSWIADTLTPSAGQGAGDWYVLTLAQSGMDYDWSGYAKALADKLQTSSMGAVSRQRCVLVLLAIAPEYFDLGETILQETLGQQGIMSYVFGLHLMHNGLQANQSEQAVVKQLCSLQCADGGWSVRGDRGDADVTAMTLQALAAHRDMPDVKIAIERGLQYLSEQQLDTGGYQSFGVANPESAAQVWMALSNLGLNGLTDARFCKNGHTLLDAVEGFRVDAGRYAHTMGGTANANATVQVLMAYLSHQRMVKGMDGLYRYACVPQNTTTAATTTTTITTAVTATASTTTEAAATATPVSTTSTATTAAVTSTMHTIYTSNSTTITTAAAADGSESARNGKIYGIVAVLVVCGAGMGILRLRGKRNPKQYVSIGIGGAVVCLLIGFVRIQSPAEYYGEQSKADAIGTVSLAIRCDVVAGQGQAPANGVILAETEYPIADGDTVLDVLYDAAQANHLQLDVIGTDTLAYVRGIQHLYEFEHGDLSGWMVAVNGADISVGAGGYTLSDGDEILWYYTVDYDSHNAYGKD